MHIEFVNHGDPMRNLDGEFFSNVKPGQNLSEHRDTRFGPLYRPRVKIIIFYEKLRKFFIGISVLALIAIAAYQGIAAAIMH